MSAPRWAVLAASLLLTARVDAAPSQLDPNETPADSTSPPRPVEPLRVELDVAPERDRLGWYVPDYVKLQTGGFLGLFTLGLGYSMWRDRINIGGTYGYMPPFQDSPRTHLVSLTVSIRPVRVEFGPSNLFYFYPIYIGFGGMIASNKNTFIQQPAIYPASYYAPNAFQFMGLVGTEAAIRERKGRLLLRHSIYIEAVTINQYLDALNQNKSFSLIDAFSTAFGYRASF